MGRKRSYLLTFLITMIAAVSPGTAKADINYTFVRMSCDPVSRSATIRAFYDWNESGKARMQRHEKNTYYLEDIGAHDPQGFGKQIQCNLANGMTVAFAAHAGDLPKHSSAALFLDGAKVDDHTLGEGEWTLEIKSVGASGYLVKYCPDFVDLSFEDHSALMSDKRECQISHVRKGVIEQSEIVPH